MSTDASAKVPLIADGPPVRYLDVNAPTSEPLWHFEELDRQREKARFHRGDFDGSEFWMLTRMEDIRAAFQQYEEFSNAVVAMDGQRNPDPPYRWIPEMLDPPLHTAWRQLLAPEFSPVAMAKFEPRMREVMHEILDDVAHRGECDFVADVALRFPNTIFMEIMGLPASDAAMFQRWEVTMLHGELMGPDSVPTMMEVLGYFTALIADRRKAPKDDLLSAAATWQIDDAPVSDEDLLSFCLLLFMAGLDTVAQELSYAMYHLATHDDDRKRIAADPGVIASAVEEFVRYYAFVTPGRKIVADIDHNGCPMKAGQMVYLPIVAANRDPHAFPDADKVILDREPNAHIGFGTGPHRCLGSHLARKEMHVFFEEWHRRIPDYRLASDVPITEHGGLIGLDNLPLRW
jgi:cytochrome P450